MSGPSLPGGPTRTTAGAGALVVRGDRLLMVRQERRTGTRWEIPGDELGPLTKLAVDRWWAAREELTEPFHVELWRTSDGYLSG